MTSYDVNVTRDGRWWMVEVPAIAGLTQARRLAEVQDMARSLISVTLDVPPSEVEIRDVNISVAGCDVDIPSAVERISELRSQALELEVAASECMRSTADAMVRAGVPLRDVGTALGVSHQRAHQLVSRRTPTRARP